MKTYGYNDRGIPILSLADKIESLKYCLEMPNDPGTPREDAMGHLFDLIHHIAPGYQFGKCSGIAEIAECYGKHPVTIVE